MYIMIKLTSIYFCAGCELSPIQIHTRGSDTGVTLGPFFKDYFVVLTLELHRFCALGSMNVIYIPKDRSLCVPSFDNLRLIKVMTSKSEMLGSWLEKFHIERS